ncbi:ferrochelatase [Sphingomonas changbaiensis]|uniref:ferrochelatase n=1 Tax=Sphingomonas changbaiensis TaxID=529705 RepID=UPI00061D3850|nr:ferrochelatase [Sphingomonas changbaiensis]
MRPEGHPPAPHGRVGVLLINLGTPDAPTAPAVRRYLAEFLSDRRVVEIPPIAWQPILRGIVLNTRPKKSAHAYGLVWTEHGSPLAHYTRSKAEKLQSSLGDGVMVDWAMRYGSPSIADKLTAMMAAGCDRILLAPMYPQYCAATTATANDKAFAVLSGLRWQPALRTLPPYYDDPAYIGALKASIERAVAGLDFAPDLILASFHGMPQRTLALGDPYHCHCQRTARLLGEALGREVRIAFQSRFGRAKWLEPPTDQVLRALPGEGIRKVAVVAPGFSVDCLETLEELAIRGRQSFLQAGGSDFAYIPCLNDGDDGIALLRGLLARELAGWVAPS